MLNDNLLKSQKTIEGNKELHKNEIKSYIDKNNLLEKKIKSYIIRETIFDKEMVKKDKKIAEMEEKYKRDIKPLLQKTNLEDFEISFTKGLNSDYYLKRNKFLLKMLEKNSSNNNITKDTNMEHSDNVFKLIELLSFSKTNYIDAISKLENKIKNISESFITYNDYLKEYFNDTKEMIYTFLYNNNLWISTDLQVIIKSNKTSINKDCDNYVLKEKIDSSLSSFKQYSNILDIETDNIFKYEENDTKYDISIDRFSNIHLNYKNNLIKLFELKKIMNEAFNLMSQTNGVDYTKMICGEFVNYKEYVKLVNTVLSQLAEGLDWRINKNTKEQLNEKSKSLFIVDKNVMTGNKRENDSKANNLKSLISNKFPQLNNILTNYDNIMSETNVIYSKLDQVEDSKEDGSKEMFNEYDFSSNNYNEIMHFENLISVLQEAEYNSLNH